MNEAIRREPPSPLETVPFNLPRSIVTTMSNGLEVVMVPDRRHPLVSISLAFRSGDTRDPRGRIGVAGAVASLLNEGTSRYNSREFAEATEELGADLTAACGSDNTIIRASSLSAFQSDLLGLLFEMALRPVFPEKELDLYRRNTIEGLKYQRSQPDFLADEQVARIIYGKHPYAVFSPNEKAIQALNREEIVAYHEAHYVPDNAVLIAVGDFEPGQLSRELESGFVGWDKKPLSVQDEAEPPERDGRTLTVVDRPGSTQANIVLANLAIKRSSPDYFPILVMNQILGAGASSRLFMNLREDKGYTYGAYSRIYAKRSAGTFEASAEVRTAVTRESLDEFFYELNRIRDERVKDVELADAKNFLTGVFPIRLETQDGLIGQMTTQRLFELPDEFLETYRARVQDVTAEDVQRVAGEYIRPDQIALVIVGDARDVVDAAGKFAGSVEVLDTNGRRKEWPPKESAEPIDPDKAAGVWSLEIDAQGQKLPVKLVLENADGELNGRLESAFGTGELGAVRKSGGSMTATAGIEFQGQKIEIAITWEIDGDKIEGTIEIPMMPEPMVFSGSRPES